MRISINEDSSAATLKVEGKLVGPWAMELGKIWQDLWASARRKPLRLDLCGLSFVDSNGTRVLRQIVRATGAEILADSPLTQFFADRARSDSTLEPKEEN
jgi:anti-anti-sigma regulatory factor